MSKKGVLQLETYFERRPSRFGHSHNIRLLNVLNSALDGLTGSNNDMISKHEFSTESLLRFRRQQRRRWEGYGQYQAITKKRTHITWTRQGFFWKTMPSKGLSSQSLPGVKKEKQRVTIVLAKNASGTDKLPPWFIGKSKNPRSLQNVSYRPYKY